MNDFEKELMDEEEIVYHKIVSNIARTAIPYTIKKTSNIFVDYKFYISEKKQKQAIIDALNLYFKDLR